VALKDHYDKLLEESDSNLTSANNKLQSILNGEDVNKQIEKVIAKLPEDKRSQISAEDVKSAISLYSELAVYDNLINDYE
jgi:hypothetical protein